MKTALLGIIMAAGFALPTLPSLGIGDFERGNRLYRQGHYAEAVTAYQQALAHGKDTPEVHYNLGTALLQMKKYAEAEQQLRAALTTVDPALRQHVSYNLGNRFLEEARAAQDTAQTQKLLDSAIDAYKQSLRLQPDDKDAKWNLELALRDKKDEKKDSGGGGGGGGNQNQDQNQKNPSSSGGGAGNSQSPSAPNGQQQGAAPQRQPLSPQQADRILSAAEQDERQLYKERLKKGQREMPVTRDW
jgi:Ca-activated chloride channel family protein